MHSYGAQFDEVHVDRDTGEIRMPRMLGVFSVGRAINPRTLRSQLIGGMTMGLSAALHEQSVRDPRFGHVVTQDLANYHISTHADVGDIDAVWLDEVDEHTNPDGVTRGRRDRHRRRGGCRRERRPSRHRDTGPSSAHHRRRSDLRLARNDSITKQITIN
jgi:hypothetical protein